MERANIMEFKVVLLGDSSVGKSSIMQQFLYNRFDPNNGATIGLDFGSKNMCFHNMLAKLNLFDTAGHERFTSTNRVYYKDTDGVVLVCSLDDTYSVSNLGKWMQEAKDYIIYNQDDVVPVYIVYNKSDLKLHIDENVYHFARTNNLPYFTTSVVRNTNIDNMFISLTNDLIKHRGAKKTNNTGSYLTFSKTKSSLTCC